MYAELFWVAVPLILGPILIKAWRDNRITVFDGLILMYLRRRDLDDLKAHLENQDR